VQREARARNRATVLSINSMVASVAFGVAAPLFGLLAERTSTQAAMVCAGAFSVLGAWFYRSALRAERARAADADPVTEPTLDPAGGQPATHAPSSEPPVPVE
jgi:hypothetical protein